MSLFQVDWYTSNLLSTVPSGPSGSGGGGGFIDPVFTFITLNCLPHQYHQYICSLPAVHVQTWRTSNTSKPFSGYISTWKVGMREPMSL